MGNKTKKLTWPWVLIAVAISFAIYVWLLSYMGEGVARAIQMSFIVIFLCARIKSELRVYYWYWLTLIMVFLIQFIVIYHISLSNHWVPSFIILPFAIVDGVLILWILQLFEKIMGVKPIAKETPDGQIES